MPSQSTIQAIAITLDIDDTPALFVLLAEDGCINRMGTGSVDNQERDLYIGVIDNAAFLELRSMVTEEWMDLGGRYELEDRAGPERELSVVFSRGDREDFAVQFVYGGESEGPPEEICEFVSAAVELTAGWAREQHAMVARADKAARPWWKFW